MTNKEIKDKLLQKKINQVMKIAENKKLQPGEHCFTNCPFCYGLNTLFISKAYNGDYFISCTNGDFNLL